jgi:hypothetical protein
LPVIAAGAILSRMRLLWTSLPIRLLWFYTVAIALGMVLWRYLPAQGVVSVYTLDQLIGWTSQSAPTAVATAMQQTTLAFVAVIAMVAAAVMTLPMAWVYTATRAARGYQQSVVHTLIMLPVTVAGVVVLVKFSIALAFSLAGIVAAVQFRNTLEDTKDAVYVFLATATGLAAAVDLPVAVAISMVFNGVALVLWYTDFGHTSARLEGAAATRKLSRAMREMSQTSTFVAHLDDQVLEHMTPEQLSSVARRAARRAQAHGAATLGGAPKQIHSLRIRTRDGEVGRTQVEAVLENQVKSWTPLATRDAGDGTHVLEYTVRFRKSSEPDEVIERIVERGAPHIIGVEVD